MKPMAQFKMALSRLKTGTLLLLRFIKLRFFNIYLHLCIIFLPYPNISTYVIHYMDNTAVFRSSIQHWSMLCKPYF